MKGLILFKFTWPNHRKVIIARSISEAEAVFERQMHMPASIAELDFA